MASPEWVQELGESR